MGVIINEFEMLIGDEEKPAAEPVNREPETATQEKELAPKDVFAIIEHDWRRRYRVLAH